MTNTTRRFTTAALALLIALAWATWIAADEARATPDGWTIQCDPAGYATYDPVTRSPSSHEHQFFGVFPTAFDWTRGDFMAAPTSCGFARPTTQDAKDHSGYWTPTMRYESGGRVPVAAMKVYYRSWVPKETVEPMPAGMRMIAGDMHASSDQTTPTGIPIVSFRCIDDASRATSGGFQVRPFDCPPEYPNVLLNIEFPQCTLPEGADGRHYRRDGSHVVYPVADPATGGQRCPNTHPVAVPKLNMWIIYDAPNGSDFRLTGGLEIWQIHADYFEAQNVAVMERLTRECINAGVQCARGFPATTP